MFGAINSVMNSVFGVTPVQTEAEINAMFDATDNSKPTTKPKPAAAKPKTKPKTKSQKRRAKAKARKEAKATATTSTPSRKPTVHTSHHHEPLTTVTHTSVNAKPVVIPAVITAKQQKMIIEILHAATVA